MARPFCIALTAFASLFSVLVCSPGRALAQIAPIATDPRPPAAQPGQGVRSVAVPPVQGTVSNEEGARLTERVRRRVAASGLTVVPTETIELAGADAILEALVVSSGEDCSLRVSSHVGASGPSKQFDAGCTNASEEVRGAELERLVGASITELVSRPTGETPPPSTPPVTPTAVPEAPREKGNAYVFETGIDLETKAFAGLGHMVAGTDTTEHFRGAFALTVVHNEIHTFDGGLAFAFGKNEIETFHGAFAVGLLTNEVREFGGVAQVGLRKNAADGKFTGVTQVAVGWNEARRFVGVGQFAVVNIARDFTGVLQLGIHNHVAKGFTGGFQIAPSNYDRGDVQAIGQIGLYNHVRRGNVRGVVQLAGLANLAEHEAQLALQLSPVNMTRTFKGAFQIGLTNFLGTKAPGDYFEDREPSNDADFSGALQLGLWNGAMRNVEIGAQVGFYNVDKSSVMGMLQAGAINGVSKNAELAFQIGGVNVVKERFSGFLEVGVVSSAGVMQGAQLGVANFGGDVRGVQIGVLNSAKSLRGLQLGLLNIGGEGAIVPVLPIFNLGL